MKSKQNNIIIKKIISKIQTMDLAGYLIDEVKDFLKYLNYYKLKNIYKNIDSFCEYLDFIDHNNTSQIHQLSHEENQNISQTDHDLYYYLSQRGLDKVGEHKIRQKLRENDYNISYIMQGIKGYLLLTVSEFCNASPTRMSINKILRSKEVEKISSQ